MTPPRTTRGRKPRESSRPRAKTYPNLDALKAATREAALAELGRPVGQLVERLWNGSKGTSATHFEGDAIRMVTELRSLFKRAREIAKRAFEDQEAIAAAWQRHRHQSSGLALAQLPPPLSRDDFIAQFPATQMLLAFVLAEINVPLGRAKRFPRRNPASRRDALAGFLMNYAPDPRYLALQTLALGAFPQMGKEIHSVTVADVIDAETKAMRRALDRAKTRPSKSKPKQYTISVSRREPA